MVRKRFNVYQVSLHVLLLVIATLMAGLVRENRLLRQRLAPPPLLAEGDAAVAVAVADLDGRQETLRFASGKKESVLLVFTTTCPACKENQPAWRSLYEDLHDRYDVIGVSLDDDAATRTYRDEHDLPFRVVIPADPQEFVRDYAVSRIPLTVHVDRDGKVRNAWLGQLSETALASFRPATVPLTVASDNS